MTADKSSGDALGDFSRLVGGSAFIFGCRLTGAVATFFTQVLLARWMGASELGIYVLAFSWCILLSTLSTGGFRIAAIRFIGEGLAGSGPGYIAGFVRRSTQITFGTSLVITSLGILILILLESVSTFSAATVFMIALFGVPFFALLNLYSGFANALSRFPLSFMPISIFRPLLFLAGIYGVWLADQALDASLSMTINLAALILVTVITAVLVRRLLKCEIADADLHYDTGNWVRTAMPLLLVGLFTGYFPSLMVIIAGPYLPSDQLAIYHVCFRVAMLISFGLVAVDAFTGPEMVKLLRGGDQQALQRAVNRITRLRFWAALLAVILMAAAGRYVLGLFGDEFPAGYSVLLILAVAQLIQAGVGPVTRLVSLSGHQNRSILVFAAAILAAIITVAVFVPLLGPEGAAIATLLVTVLWVFWMRFIVVRTLDIRPSIF